LRRAQNPAYTYGERVWFVFYGIASVAFRIFICIRILLFLNDRLPEELFILVPLFAFSAIVAWVFVPVGKFLQFLATGAELTRKRARAVGLTFGTFCLIAVCIGLIRVPDYWRVEGVVEPVRLAIVHAESDGFVVDFLPSESKVSFLDGPPLIRAVNPELEAEKKRAVAERSSLKVQRRIAEMQEIAVAQILDEQLKALDEKIARLEFELASLNLDPPLSGTWVAPDIEHFKGIYLSRGQSIGFVASLDDVIIRATAGQEVAAMLIEQALKQVEIRVKGQPKLLLTGEIEQIFPAGQELLPSEALGYSVGGSMPTLPQDPQGTKAAEMFFEIRIRPDADSSVRLLTGQRVVARIRMLSKPLAVQWWLSVRQLFQRRFHI
jgi:putative peptide zinc metalloprotease protein